MSSTTSFQRLRVKVKRSISGITEVCDGYESSEKENESPDRFSRSYTSLASLESSQLSPLRESPSRRKQFMGSLRRIGSLRSIRSSPLKEKGKQRMEDAVELGEFPQTPMRVIRPSLALNFQQSSPDQPMFDVLERKSSVASSLEVQHSSPVPIHVPAKPEELLRGVPAYPTGFMPETLPNTPGPLQMALERETRRSSTESHSSPVHPQQGHGMSPMPTPMPGTSFGFCDDDLVGPPQKEHEASSLELSSEPSSYFSVPVSENFASTDSSNVGGVADRVVYTGCRDDTVSATAASCTVGTANKEPTTVYHLGTHGSGSSTTRCNHNHDNHPLHDRGAGRTVCNYCRVNRRESTGSETPPQNTEHTLYEDNTENRPKEHRFARHAYFFRPAETQNALQMQAHPLATSAQPTLTDSGARPATPQNTWGTDGSLYDGTGYGGVSGSTSGRPSTSSTAPGAPVKTSSGTAYTASSLALESAAMAQEHESMDEVIRTYAALEGRRTFSIGENDTEDFVAEAQADVDLANEMADHSLGA